MYTLLKAEDVNTLSRAEIIDRHKSETDAAAALWKKYRDTDGKISEDEAKEIRERNDNIGVLKGRLDSLTALDEAGKSIADAQRFQNEPVNRPAQPAAQAEMPKSLGQQFVESLAYKKFEPTRGRGPSATLDDRGFHGLDAKTVLTLSTYPLMPTDTGRVVLEAMRRPVVADLIPQSPTNASSLRYVRETTLTNNAAATAEGAQKPESALGYTQELAPINKIATIIPATDELMEDAPALAGLIDARLRLFIQLVEENEILSGSGTAPHMTGILNTSGVLTQAQGTDPLPDAVYKAMVKIQTTAFLDPSGSVWNPLDWQSVRLLTTADGIYLWGPPSAPGPQTIFGLPVVATTAMAQGTILVGAFNAAAQIYRRSGIEVLASSENVDNFEKNIVSIRAEERLGLVVYRPQAFATVTTA